MKSLLAVLLLAAAWHVDGAWRDGHEGSDRPGGSLAIPITRTLDAGQLCEFNGWQQQTHSQFRRMLRPLQIHAIMRIMDI